MAQSGASGLQFISVRATAILRYIEHEPPYLGQDCPNRDIWWSAGCCQTSHSLSISSHQA
jgi:hypothetical protein